jgi:hypothetical protein
MVAVAENGCTKTVTETNGRRTETLTGIVPNLSNGPQHYEISANCYATVADDGPDNDDRAIGTYTCVQSIALALPKTDACRRCHALAD